MNIVEKMRSVAANIRSGGSIGAAATIDGWADRLSAPCAQMSIDEENDGGGCTLAGPGRGDCMHFVGLHGQGENVYGKPYGWCWFCWQAKQLEDLRTEALAISMVVTKLLALLKPGEEPMQIGGELAVACDSALTGIYIAKRDLYARACEIAGRTE